MTKVQEYINNNFPKNSKIINVAKKGLAGSLDLREYPQLEELVVEINQITELILSENNKNITKIEAYNNQLTNLNFLKTLPNPEKVKWLGFFQNKITLNNLDILTPFVNCEMLSIGKNNIRGNLHSLRYWTNLKRLDLIGVPQQILGLEYIAHNPFDWENHPPFGQFFQDYIPRNREELNSNDWRGSRTNFRKSADAKVQETITNLWRQFQQLNQAQINNQKLEQQLTISQQENQALQGQIQQKQQVIDNQQNQINQFQQQVQGLNELSAMVLPNDPYNFNQLKSEITRLKHQELAPQVRNKKTQLEQSITQTKAKVGNLEKIIDLLLETQQQIVQTNNTSQKDKLSGKLEAYQNILEGNLNKQELQNLLTQQTELVKLEKQLTSLQVDEQVTQIQQANLPFNPNK